MKAHTDAAAGQSHYTRLLLMIVVSFIAMYGLMYAMVNSFANVYMNVNQVYMAGLMAAPMGEIELALMGGMYHDKRLNRIIIGISIVAMVLFWTLIRHQTTVSDTQFLRSMIPHHAGAILMCEEAPIRDADIKTLCKEIVAGQRAEIDQMKAKLRALDN